MTTIEVSLRAMFRLSIAACIFLAFAWPFFVSPDPGGAAFRILAVGSLVAFLGSLASLVALRMARRNGGGTRRGR